MLLRLADTPLGGHRPPEDDAPGQLLARPAPSDQDRAGYCFNPSGSVLQREVNFHCGDDLYRVTIEQGGLIAPLAYGVERGFGKLIVGRVDHLYVLHPAVSGDTG